MYIFGVAGVDSGCFLGLYDVVGGGWGVKKEYYLDQNRERDWIDKCAEDMTLEAFNGAMFFTIGKYYQRLGKKDPEEQEKFKVLDYMQRWRMVLTDKYSIPENEAEDWVFSAMESAKQLAQE